MNEWIIELTNSFDGQIWSNNGPYMLTKVLKTHCAQSELKNIKPSNCGNLTVYDPDAFYAIPWRDGKELYGDNLNHSLEHSFSVHLWNRHGLPIEEAPETSVLKRLAKEHCPKTQCLWNKVQCSEAVEPA